MTRNRIVFAALVGTVLAGSLLAAPFWQKEDYLKWSRKECQKLLMDSPWAQSYTLTGLHVPAPMNLGTNPRGENPPRISTGPGGVAGDRETYLFIQLRFLTAKPVRAAMGRLQLMARPDEPQFEEQVKSWVEQPEGEQIVVEVTYYSRPGGHRDLRRVENFFRSNTLEQLKTRCYLSHDESETSLSLSDYQAPGEGNPRALLFFPRFDEQGQPHFSGDEETILLRIETDFEDIEQQFHPDEMRYESGFTI